MAKGDDKDKNAKKDGKGKKKYIAPVVAAFGTLMPLSVSAPAAFPTL